MADLRTSVIGLAEQIIARPDERALLCKALRVKLGELRKRGETVPPEILDLERTLERLDAFDALDPDTERPV